MKVHSLSGDDLRTALPALARLRVEVFRAFPYLYEGNVAYEAGYLQDFAQARDAIIVVAQDEDGEIVGCATGSALIGHHAEFATPLANAGFSLSSTFYFGESVLKKEWRGRGIGHAFFDQREAHAQQRGYKRACFCAVERAADHPLRPADYSPIDPFWIKRGYRKHPDLEAHFNWPTAPGGEATPHSMKYWIREF